MILRQTSRVLALGLLLAAGCGGGGAQDRPVITAFFPADGTTVGWVDAIRVTYDEPVRILNRRAVRLGDAETGEGVYVEAFADPGDERSILVKPLAGVLVPNHRHRVVVQEGAVVNGADHYALDESSVEFVVGDSPNLVVTASDGIAYEVDDRTGAQVSSTLPPAGYRAREPVGSAGRIWVWLDPVPGPGDSLLGTFVPGDAAMTIVPLLGETGRRIGVSFALSIDGETLYATAIDEGRARLRLHRILVAPRTELIPPIELSPVVTPTQTSFRPALDLRRQRLYVPVSDGAGGGSVAIVDLRLFAELDGGPGPGVDALPTPDGAGPIAYEPLRDVFFMLLADAPAPGFLLVGPDDFAQFPAREPSIVGAPAAIYVTPDGRYVVQGLDGYAGTSGIVRSDAQQIGEGFALPVRDDVGGVLVGSDVASILLDDPARTRFHVIASNATTSFLVDYEWLDERVLQIDLDPATDGVQAISLAAAFPGVATGAAYPRGAVGP